MQIICKFHDGGRFWQMSQRPGSVNTVRTNIEAMVPKRRYTVLSDLVGIRHLIGILCYVLFSE